MQTISKTSSLHLFHRGDLELLQIENEFGRALVSVQGAQLLSYKRKCDGKEFLWLSESAVFETGKAIRGGVPVCLPWFGPKEGKVQHGFARNQDWRHCDGEAIFEFVARADDPRHDFDCSFTATLEMVFTDQLRLNLTVVNDDIKPMALSWALHSYHPVVDVEKTTVSGLDGCDYLDNTRGRARSTQSGVIAFSGEVDRAYMQAGETQRIDNFFDVSATNAQSAVIWNPGEVLAKRMPDLSDHRGFVCLERGDVIDDERLLEPSETFTTSVTVRALT